MRFSAYRGRGGVIEFTIEDDAAQEGTFQPMNLTGATVGFIAGGQLLDSNGASVTLDTTNSKALLIPGDFNLVQAQYPVELIVTNTTYPSGKTIAGPGKDNHILMDFYVPE